LARARSDSLGPDEPSRDRLDDLKAKDARPFDPSAMLRASFFRSGQDLRKHKLYPAPAAEAGFTILVYTKSTIFPSSKIS